MNQNQIDNLIEFLWNQYRTDDNEVNKIINELLQDCKQQLEGMKEG